MFCKDPVLCIDQTNILYREKQFRPLIRKEKFFESNMYRCVFFGAIYFAMQCQSPSTKLIVQETFIESGTITVTKASEGIVLLGYLLLFTFQDLS